MRLIDADVFKTEYENLITWVSHRAEKTRLREFIKDIQNQPTVKAIPIEWIKSKKIEYQHDRYDYVRGCFDGFNDCIDYLINEWEKENETN